MGGGAKCGSITNATSSEAPIAIGGIRTSFFPSLFGAFSSLTLRLGITNLPHPKRIACGIINYSLLNVRFQVHIEQLFIVDSQGMDEKHADSSAIRYPHWELVQSKCF
jgi:hypothetical protein